MMFLRLSALAVGLLLPVSLTTPAEAAPRPAHTAVVGEQAASVQFVTHRRQHGRRHAARHHVRRHRG